VVLLVAIAAGNATRAWERVLLLILNFVFEAGALLSLFGEVWFLAKTIMAAGMGAAGALSIAIVVGLGLIAPAVWLIRLIVSTGYGLLGRRAEFRSDFGGSLWVHRTGTWRPREFSRRS
jgi:hypothetical protein